MRYPPNLLDDIRARISVSQVVSRKVALKKAGRELRGLSPFKAERTPSFFVNDQKGFYHCFASGEHGDIFTFLIKTEGLSFPEAVERLAQEAGVPLPRPEARDPEREDQRARLHALMEASCAYFEERLRSGAGAEARRYLDGRGLTREAIQRFRLGYATPSRSALREHLATAGFTLAEMAASGMLISGDDIPVAYDRFRHRVMFPILDLKGRVIAFGGRALDKDQPAKYLNSPETPLFHKGAILFNAAKARQAAFERSRVVAVEGYMDVIALAEAGFPETVAPLGTALTEDQVQLLWRMAPEPILCFDGDSAGRKAAFRAVDTVLAHLKPGRSVAFAFLPDGLDPDDLIRQQGAEAMQAALARARPLADVLWEREWGAGGWSTPERRAQLLGQLMMLASRIADPSVRSLYERELRDRFYSAVRAASGSVAAGQGTPRGRPPAQSGPGAIRRVAGLPGGPGRRGAPPSPFAPMPAAPPSAGLRQSRLVAGLGSAPPPREALLLKALLNHPWLVEDHAEEIAELPLTSPALTRLRDAILMLQASDNSLDRSRLASQLTSLSLDKVADLVERAVTHKSDRFASPDADRDLVERGWRDLLALHRRQCGLRQDLELAERDWHRDGSEDALARIIEIQRQLAQTDGAEGAEAGSGTV